MTPLRLRSAGPDDAEGIALLHAGSWRRNYRGAYSDAFLGGDVVADRLAVWSRRLADRQARAATVVAEHGTDLVGFVHVVFDADEKWGSLIDNLHVGHDRRRAGIGSALITRAAEEVTQGAAADAVHLWVLEQNTHAQGFYRTFGGVCVERALVPAPGGIPERLHGSPVKLRFAWADPALVTRRATR
jgi:ribosomal protein S18 acetylase RimI-like enzyme